MARSEGPSVDLHIETRQQLRAAQQLWKDLSDNLLIIEKCSVPQIQNMQRAETYLLQFGCLDTILGLQSQLQDHVGQVETLRRRAGLERSASSHLYLQPKLLNYLSHVNRSIVCDNFLKAALERRTASLDALYQRFGVPLFFEAKKRGSRLHDSLVATQARKAQTQLEVLLSMLLLEYLDKGAFVESQMPDASVI